MSGLARVAGAAAAAAGQRTVYFGGMAYKAIVGSWSYSATTGLQQSTGVVNDEISWDVLVDGGTYTFVLLHNASTNRGIYSVRIDDVEVGTIDGYNGSALTKRDAITVVIAASGIVELSLVTATKNASSSAYIASVAAVMFARTGA